MRSSIRVRIWFANDSSYAKEGVRDTVLHNITEIHYQYPKSYAAAPDRVAFESDIDGTGSTYDLADIKEFEARIQIGTGHDVRTQDRGES